MRRCKQCRIEIPPAAKCADILLRKGFCSYPCSYKHELSKQQSAKPRQKPFSAKKKPKSIARLRNDVSELVQRLVRLKAADSNGMVKCWTCDTVKHWKEMQGGHFIERGKTATKMLEENIHPQCPSCNQWGMKKASTVLLYRREMVAWYGEDFVSWLENESKKSIRHTRQELQALIADYTKQIQHFEGLIT
jgi:uncharacterized alpha-E superfamily protein